jgi:hypothetical protein
MSGVSPQTDREDSGGTSSSWISGAAGRPTRLTTGPRGPRLFVPASAPRNAQVGLRLAVPDLS